MPTYINCDSYPTGYVFLFPGTGRHIGWDGVYRRYVFSTRRGPPPDASQILHVFIANKHKHDEVSALANYDIELGLQPARGKKKSRLYTIMS